MFRSVKPETITEVTAADPSEPVADLVPLSVLALDLADPPPEGWHLYLARRGTAITLDDIGRPSIDRGDARMLLTAKREAEAQQAQFRAEQDRRAEQQDRLHRASLPAGIPAGLIPDGLAPAEAMVLAGESSGPRAKSVHEQLLESEFGSGDSMMYHSFGPDES
jgi:hypothetical protein